MKCVQAKLNLCKRINLQKTYIWESTFSFRNHQIISHGCYNGETNDHRVEISVKKEKKNHFISSIYSLRKINNFCFFLRKIKTSRKRIFLFYIISIWIFESRRYGYIQNTDRLFWIASWFLFDIAHFRIDIYYKLNSYSRIIVVQRLFNDALGVLRGARCRKTQRPLHGLESWNKITTLKSWTFVTTQIRKKFD